MGNAGSGTAGGGGGAPSSRYTVSTKGVLDERGIRYQQRGSSFRAEYADYAV